MQEKNNAQSQSFQTAIENAESHSQYLLDSRNNKSQISILKQMVSSKRISLAMLSINMSNVITAPVYGAFMIAEALFPIYSLAIIIQSQIYDINIEDTWIVENYMDSEPIKDYLFINIAILLIYLVMIIMLGITCYHKESFTQVKDNSFIQTTLSIMTSALLTFLVGVYLHIILRVFLIKTPEDDLGLYVALQLINAINFAILLWTQIFLKRVITLKLPSPRQPFAKIDHRNDYLLFFLEIGIIGVEVIFANFHQMFQYVDVISIILLIITLGVCLSKLFVVPIYNKLINTIQNFMLWITLSCCFIIVINAFDKSVSAVNVYYLAILLPFMLGMSFLIQYHWEYRIMDKIRVNQSKMEVQHQYILYLLTEHVRNLRGDKEHQNQSLKYLFGILDDHNGECLKNSCLCHQSESIVWILNQKNDENQQIIELSGQDIDFLNSIQNDRLYTKEHYSTAPFTFNDYQDKKYIMLRKKQVRFNKDNEEKNYTMEFVFEDDKTEEALQNDYFILKIDPTRLKQAFFANFVRQYYEQAILKFPESYQIKIMYANFALFQMRNMFLSINILKQIDVNRLSFIDKCSFYQNEHLLINEIQSNVSPQENYQQGFQPDLLGVTNFQKVSIKSQQDLRQLEPESFLSYSILQEKFHESTLELSRHIMQFWYLISDSVLMVDKVLAEAFQVARLIALTYKTFKLMDDASKHKNEKIYYNFAIIHLQLLNDSQNYNLYMSKMKNVISMKKFIQKNYQMSDSFSDHSILLVSGKLENYGKIIECNKQFQKLTGYKWQDLRYSSYEIIMNDMIKQSHSSFVNEFNRTGEKIILDKKVNQFIKKKNGYIVSVQLIVRSHFSNNHGYTFIGFLSEVQEISLDGHSSIGIKTKDLMFMLCDNQEGRVYNVCKNTAKYLGIKKHYLIENSSYLDFEIRAGQISPYLDITQLRDTIRNNQGKRDNLFYGMFKLDLNVINQRVQSVFQSTNFVNARFKIFCEQFQNNAFEYFVIVIQLIDKEIQHQPQSQIDLIKSQSGIDGETDGQVLMLEEGAPSSHTSSDSSKQNDQIKSQNISMERTTPRSLRIVIQLLLLMFITMITVSAVNLYLSQSRQQRIISQVDVANKSSLRLQQTARCRLLVRQLLNIANGLEPINSTYTTNRTAGLKNLLFDIQESFRQTQNFLFASTNLFSEDFQDYVKNNLLDIEYLDENGRTYREQHTLSYLTNIFTTKLLEIYNMNINQLNTKMDFKSLKPVSTGFKPTQYEQSIYFTVQNGNNILNQHIWLLDDMYNEQINSYAYSTIDQTQITILISIFTIIGVFIVVTPIISLIQDRQFTALIFFVEIPKNKIQSLVDQTQHCLNQLLSESDVGSLHERQHNENYEQDKHNRKIYQGDQSDNSSQFNQKQSQNAQDRDNYSDANVSFNTHQNNNTFLNYTKQENTISDMDILVTLNNEKNLNYNNNNEVGQRKKYQDSQVSRIQEESKSQQINSQVSNQQPVKKRSFYDVIIRKNSKKQYQDSEIELSDSNSSNNLKVQRGQRAKNEDFDSINEIEKIKNINQNDLVNLQQVNPEEAKLEEEEKQMKLLNLLQFKKRKRIKAVVISLIFMTCFCLYFMGSFFITQNTYLKILKLYNNLNSIYNKDICMENVIVYQRESYAQNISYTLEFGSQQEIHQTIATTFYLNQCLQLENEYTQIRRENDDGFQYVKKFMQDIETENLCKVINPQNTTIQGACMRWYNGILKKGMQNSMSIMLSNLNQYDLRFNSMRNRTEKDLSTLSKNQDFLELIELKLFFMDTLFNQLKNKSFDSVNQYLQTQTNAYIIFFTAFIVAIFILLILVFGVALGKMRNYLWRINLAMKILPIDVLSNQSIQSLKKFFKQ
eukprot:403343159